MKAISERIAQMRRIVDAAGDRDLTKSQTHDFREASRAVLDLATDALDAPAVKSLAASLDGIDSLPGIVSAMETWYVRHGRKSAGRLVHEDDITLGAFPTSEGMRSSYKAALDWGTEFVEAREASGTKALLDAGSVEVTVPLATEPVTDARQAKFVYELIPSDEAPGSHFAYLRQTTRTNNAAVVPSGGLKPQSVYTLERIDDRTKVIAHVSEALDRFLFEDAPMLKQFLSQELLYGLNKALDARAVAQIRTAAAAGSVTLNLAGIRGAITTLETSDLPPTGIVLNPTDWQAVEAEATTIFASNDNIPAATDAMARRLYGIPVAVSNSIAAGTALVGDFRGSAKILRTGGASITVHDSHPRTVDTVDTADFRVNQVMFRAEMRAEIAVTRPAGFLEVGVAA